jgi:hypothetical protein
MGRIERRRDGTARRRIVAFAAIAWLSAIAAPAEPQSSQSPKAPLSHPAPPSRPPPGAIPEPTLPDREAQFIAIVEKARTEFTASRSNDARTTVRLGQQITLHEFVGTNRTVTDWVGTFKGSKIAQNGYRSVLIEIGPGITVATWDTPYADGRFETMVKPFAPMAQVLSDLEIGQNVVFNAELIGMVLGNDNDMVMHPRVLAKISKLVGLETPLPR